MPKNPTEFLDAAIAAPEIVKQLKNDIPEKSGLYGFPYFLALIGCIALHFYDSNWLRWTTGFLIAICLAAAWSMRGTLAELARALEALRTGDFVLRNHRIMNAIAIALLVYALAGNWGRWPLPALAILAALAINFAHFAGYRDPK